MIYSIKKYFTFYLKAKTKYGIHSPFVFDFIEQVFESKTTYYSFPAIEYVRKSLKKNKRVVTIVDLGAGSRILSRSERTISNVARISLQKKNMAAVLFRIINYYGLESEILELGTSLGISTAYLSTANKRNTIYTIEGSKEIAAVAEGVFKQLGLKNVKLLRGDFDDFLPKLEINNSLGLVYIDGNHTKEATLRYFHWALEKANEQTVIVFDDIYWSKEMEQAWEEIKENKKVTLTIDLFTLGIVFLHNVKSKEHFKLKKSFF